MWENALERALFVLFRHAARSPRSCGVIKSFWRWHQAWRETLGIASIMPLLSRPSSRN